MRGQQIPESIMSSPRADAEHVENDGLALPREGAGSPAGAGRRFLALCLDWLAASLAVRLVFPDAAWGTNGYAWLVMAVFGVEVALLTWLGGASFGQRLARVRVVGLGRRPGLLAVVVRTILICLVLPALIWDSDGRGIHDRVAGTVVVRR